MNKTIITGLSREKVLAILGLMVPKPTDMKNLVSVDSKVADLNSALRDVFLSEDLRGIVTAAGTDIHLYGPRTLHQSDLGLLHKEWMAVTSESYGNVKTYEMFIDPVRMDDGQLYFSGNHLASWLHDRSEGKFTRQALAEKLVYELSQLRVPALR